MYSTLLVVFTTVLILQIVAQDPAPIVDTNYGKVQGVMGLDRLNRTYASYLGIPFAKPPINELRWAKPQPPDPWEDVLDASVWSTPCIQPLAFLYPVVDFNGNDTEDCLYINVVVPRNLSYALANPRPVMLFYYGGGLQFGTAEMYPGQELATEADVVFVNVNYRVSSMGFFSTGDDVAPGNYGLWDTKAALEWTNVNIASFGGDPTMVTIFGQSAGASIVSHLMLSPQTNTQFERGIAISGNAWYEDNNNKTKERAQFIAELFNCNSTDSQQMVDCLRLVDGKRLDNRAWFNNLRNGTDHVLFNVVLDGEFVDQDIRKSWEEGRGGDLDFITGFCYHDSAGIIVGKILGAPNPIWNITDDYNKNRSEVYAQWERHFDEYDNADELIQTLYDLFPDMNSSDPAVASETSARVQTDLNFGSPVFYEGEKHTESGRSGATYMYMFKHRQSFLGGYPEWTNGSHLDDVYSVLGDPFMTVFREALLGEFDDDDRKLSTIIMKYYGNFAHTGNPSQGPHAVDLDWPEYDVTTRQYLVQTPTPIIETQTQEVLDHYNWLLYDFHDMMESSSNMHSMVPHYIRNMFEEYEE